MKATGHDLVIRGGTVADGRGGTPFYADVGIRDGVIEHVGPVAETGREEIDAGGMLVTPGFVDIHTHYDGQAIWDTRLQPSSWHGVTTVVMGNCGVGFAPVRAQDRDRLVELMEGVENIPGIALHEGLDWRWESFGDYLDALGEHGRDMDICAQLPHGALRYYVMGERAGRLEMATEADIAKMRHLSAAAMRAGAVGFSTSRTLNHRTIKGDPTPSLRASEEELTGIALGLKDAGTGVLEFISDWDQPDVEGEFAMVRRVVEASGRPLSFSLAQRHSTPHIWRQLIELTERAVADGLNIKAQVAPRPIGTLLSLQGSRNPFSSLPSYRTIADEPLAQRVALMRDRSFRETLLAEAASVEIDGHAAARQRAFGFMFPLGSPPEYEPARERSIAAQAVRERIDAASIAYDMLLENDGKFFIFAPIANYADYNLDVCGEMIANPHTLMGLGDGGAHVGIISDGSFTTYLLTHWGRDRNRGRFGVGYLVRRLTYDNALAMGLDDRGIIAPGMKADVNVIDFERLAIEAPYIAHDLPAGGKRLLQRSTGYVATIVSGRITYRDGEPTDALPGRLVRARCAALAA